MYDCGSISRCEKSSAWKICSSSKTFTRCQTRCMREECHQALGEAADSTLGFMHTGGSLSLRDSNDELCTRAAITVCAMNRRMDRICF